MKKRVVTLMLVMTALVATAAPEGTDVVTKQPFPWNGLVGIA